MLGTPSIHRLFTMQPWIAAATLPSSGARRKASSAQA